MDESFGFLLCSLYMHEKFTLTCHTHFGNEMAFAQKPVMVRFRISFERQLFGSVSFELNVD